MLGCFRSLALCALALTLFLAPLPAQAAPEETSGAPTVDLLDSLQDLLWDFLDALAVQVSPLGPKSDPDGEPQTSPPDSEDEGPYQPFLGPKTDPDG